MSFCESPEMIVTGDKSVEMDSIDLDEIGTDDIHVDIGDVALVITSTAYKKLSISSRPNHVSKK